MTLANELLKLQELKDAGTLSQSEFARAKETLLQRASVDESSEGPTARFSDSLGDAARTWVRYQIIMGIVGLVIFAIVFVGFWLPQWNRMSRSGLPPQSFPLKQLLPN